MEKKRGPGRPRKHERSRVRLVDLREETAKGGRVQQVIVVARPGPRPHSRIYTVYLRVSWRRGYHAMREARERWIREFPDLDQIVDIIRQFYGGEVRIYDHNDPELRRIRAFSTQKE